MQGRDTSVTDVTDRPQRAGKSTQRDESLRLYAVVRSDLGMSPGKMAAQAGHAFVDTLRDASVNWDTDTDAYRDYLDYIQLKPGTKVVLAARDEEALRRLHNDAWRFLEIPSALVTDSGHVLPPHFTGQPIVTAVGIGPCTREKAAKLLRGLALVP